MPACLAALRFRTAATSAFLHCPVLCLSALPSPVPFCTARSCAFLHCQSCAFLHCQVLCLSALPRLCLSALLQQVLCLSALSSPVPFCTAKSCAFLHCCKSLAALLQQILGLSALPSPVSFCTAKSCAFLHCCKCLSALLQVPFCTAAKSCAFLHCCNKSCAFLPFPLLAYTYMRPCALRRPSRPFARAPSFKSRAHVLACLRVHVSHACVCAHCLCIFVVALCAFLHCRMRLHSSLRFLCLAYAFCCGLVCLSALPNAFAYLTAILVPCLCILLWPCVPFCTAECLCIAHGAPCALQRRALLPSTAELCCTLCNLLFTYYI